MSDRIYESFLHTQFEEGMALAAQSDILDLVPLDANPVRHYLAHYSAKGLVFDGADPAVTSESDIRVVTGCTVEICFPDDYLRRCVPFEVIAWIEPIAVFHPNIRPPFICVGRIAPQTSLVDLLYQCYEIFTYTKATWVEHDALNRPACAWARRNQHRFPIDPRPLKRRRLNLQTTDAKGA